MFGPYRVSLALSDGTQLELQLYYQTTNTPNTVYVTHCQEYGVWLQTGFGLMTESIGLSDTARDYILQFTVTRTLMSLVESSLLMLGSGF
jgi:hypothetical protein